MHASVADKLRNTTRQRAEGARGGWLVGEQAIMGTAIRVELWCESRGVGNAAIDAVMAEMHRIDRAMSPYKPDSELSRINRDAFAQPVHVSRELFALLARAQDFSQLSGGVFDITYAAVGHLYDYRAGTAPTPAELAAARAAIGWRNLILDPLTRTVRFARRRHAHRPRRIRQGPCGRLRSGAARQPRHRTRDRQLPAATAA